MESSEYEHRCQFIPSNDIYVYCSDEFLDSEVWEWCLVIQRSASESDLEENHYLDEVGDSIWQTIVGISHCPYCGENLESVKCNKAAREAEFFHIDSSGWAGKVL